MDVVIDGQTYSPVSSKIGIGITTKDRPEILAQCLDNLSKHLPADAKVIIVDDGSQKPATSEFEVIRNPNPVGIPRAKNQCLKALKDCDHIFLFDDDCWPIVDGWYQPYIDSKEHHLAFIFDKWASGQPVGDCEKYHETEHEIWWTHSRGCMVYLDALCLHTLGGYAKVYGMGYEEHMDYSDRSFAAGLTSWRYMDVKGSENLFRSLDREKAVNTTTPNRKPLLDRNIPIRANRKAEYNHDYEPIDDVIYLAADIKGTDPQNRMKQQTYSCDALKRSCPDVVILTETQTESPYNQRWKMMYSYLLAHPASEVWLLDGYDVEMLRRPSIEPGKLYTGCEEALTDSPWMQSNFQDRKELFENPTQLLNCGVVGGDYTTIMRFLRSMLDELSEPLEMGAFNTVARRFDVVTGIQVVTRFKANERNQISWWKHK